MLRPYNSTGNVFIDVTLMTFMFCGGFIVFIILDIISDYKSNKKSS